MRRAAAVAPAAAVYPLPPEDHALIARLVATGVEICGTCSSLAVEAPISPSCACYCRVRHTWEKPWFERCDRFTLKETPNG